MGGGVCAKLRVLPLSLLRLLEGEEVVGGELAPSLVPGLEVLLVLVHHGGGGGSQTALVVFRRIVASSSASLIAIVLAASAKACGSDPALIRGRGWHFQVIGFGKVEKLFR